MSKFLRSLVRSEGKSCEGKIKYPRLDSAERSAAAMTDKKRLLAEEASAPTTEYFESYKCDFCDGWHIGHMTNFDWIPQSHRAQHLMMNGYQCFGKVGVDNHECLKVWITNTVFSNRIIEHFPNVKDEPEQLVRCPKCKGMNFNCLGRRWLNLETVNPDDTITIEELWKNLTT